MPFYPLGSIFPRVIPPTPPAIIIFARVTPRIVRTGPCPQLCLLDDDDDGAILWDLGGFEERPLLLCLSATLPRMGWKGDITDICNSPRVQTIPWNFHLEISIIFFFLKLELLFRDEEKMMNSRVGEDE